MFFFKQKIINLKVFATDLEVSLTDQAETLVEKPGKIAVNAKNLFDIIRELGDGEPISLETKIQ